MGSCPSKTSSGPVNSVESTGRIRAVPGRPAVREERRVGVLPKTESGGQRVLRWSLKILVQPTSSVVLL